MYIFFALAAFLLINRLYKFIKVTPLWLKWGTVLSYGQWMVWAIYLVTEIFLGGTANLFIGSTLLLAVVYFAEKEEDFKVFKSFIFAHYPLIAVGYITGIVKLIASASFLDKYDDYSAIAIVGAFVWIFARLASSKKQQEEFKMVNLRNTELDRLVAERTAELTSQKEELQATLEQLQTTQQQLIQSEKLASLGELTAGIAHEIQNPLNFVNNFSEVSMEMMDEMEEELNKGDKEEAIAIANDIKQNLEKILHHGQRADSIVKGMLQHSRASSNTKEPADINKLADEYLRLAYHGLRAKDKSFNADLVTNLSEGLPMVNMVPQDMGRVLLNMFNNAFYAVQQKQKTTGNAFKPVIKLSTSVKGKFIEIEVEDNGSGIPDDIIDKILQPFFTTKPTGEGTGLGLSLSYDIVVKGHGGKIDVTSKENEGSKFIITLPVS
jgi:two-component system NtrC family sensor kinase